MKRIIYLLSSLLTISLLLSACGSAQPQLTPTEIPTVVAATVSPPTETPVPIADKVWLITGDSLHADDVNQISQGLLSLANASGWKLETFQTLAAQDLSARAGEVKMIVIFPPDPGLNEWISSYPQITFLPVGITGLSASANTYPILPDGLHPEWESYLAGYIAATLTDDSRIGMVTQAGWVDSAKSSQGFVNGGVMFCGLCNPIYPPYEDYPLTTEINAGTAQTDWQPTIDAFLSKQVKTVYVSPSVASPELMLYMAQYGVRLLSSTPPPAGLEPAWIGYIHTDYVSPLTSAWADALAAQPAGFYPVQITITPIDTSLLTEGKLKWFQKVIDDLTNGFLIP